MEAPGSVADRQLPASLSAVLLGVQSRLAVICVAFGQVEETLYPASCYENQSQNQD